MKLKHLVSLATKLLIFIVYSIKLRKYLGIVSNNIFTHCVDNGCSTASHHQQQVHKAKTYRRSSLCKMC